MNKTIDALLQQLNISPRDREIFYQAFTHPSFANEQRKSKSYQRLEFLGDAILEKLATVKVFTTYPKLTEGEMTEIRNNAVSGKTISKFALEFNFDQLIRVGRNNDHLRKSDKILEDIFEAFVAALFIDQGEEKAKEFLQSNVFKFIDEAKNKELKNPKTILQEFLQAESREIIYYETHEKGKEFVSEVFHDGNSFGKGIGKTKKEAEIDAALNALKLMGKVK